jgi:EAL domain-containing protein (putative c-di-GMP-specific phosphodiesterase class I)/CRP-like cAMP-binding protein
MSSLNVHKTFKKGETIFMEGEPGSCAYIIERGKVNLFILVEGKQKLISELHDGAVFGEMSIIDDQLRSATAVAAQDAHLIVIPGKYFDEKLEGADKFVTMLLKLILQRYREMRSRLETILPDADAAKKLSIIEKNNAECERNAFYAARQLEAESGLKDALENRQLELFYQPIVALQTQQVVGCESLLRWRHPEQGLLPPGGFIPLAETTGLIVPIGLWIIEEAGKAGMRFQNTNRAFSFISVNLSGRQFVPFDFAGDVRKIFEGNKIDPRKIEFEITESILMANPLKTAAILNDLKALGAKIAIDDFGTGYSSFSYLHRFPIDILKIDRSFISTMVDNAKSFEIVKSLCILAKSIGMTVIAEGVETEKEHNLLIDLGSDYGQGYFYAKPMPELEFHDFLTIS